MNEFEVSCYEKAGKIIQEVKKYTCEIVKFGMNLFDLAQRIEGKIKELGGEIAFPVNLSINEIAAHYTAILNDEKKAEGLLKVDIGVAIEGFIADTAICFDLTEDKKYQDMINLNKAILENITKKIHSNMRVYEVGEIATEILENWNLKNGTNYSIIGGLCGHGLGKNQIHSGLIIPNYLNDNSKELKEMAFAIEPFVTTGTGNIYEGEGGGIYVLKKKIPVRDRDARNIVNYIGENYLTRPFCARWLINSGFEKVNYLLGILKRQGIIYEYPMLIEKTKGVVSQVENSFVNFNGEVKCISCEN